jgi:hypothetical protein
MSQTTKFLQNWLVPPLYWHSCPIALANLNNLDGIWQKTIN